LLRYVDGDYKDPATFQSLRNELGPEQPNYCRFQISPDVTLAFGVNVLAAAEDTGDAVELLASHHPGTEEMDAYERVLGDAMAGDGYPVRSRGLCRRGLAHCRSCAQSRHSGLRLRTK
jgi:glucose-6-phosphate 1-dehydrogenase